MEFVLIASVSPFFSFPFANETCVHIALYPFISDNYFFPCMSISTHKWYAEQPSIKSDWMTEKGILFAFSLFFFFLLA